MIRGLILYYLNLKETHGYEIQRFLQLTGVDSWAKIQSGSIYYALSKLEKEKNIRIVSEEGTGQRARKIYAITEKGKETLHTEMLQELSQPITAVGSVKFITDPILSTLSKEEMESVITHHLSELNQQLGYWQEWQKVKAEGQKNHLIYLSFEITIRSLKDQIMWHEELLKNLDGYISQSQAMKQMIQSFDADSFLNAAKTGDIGNQIDLIKKLKETIVKNPELAIQDLDRLLEALKI